jgi:uncharacterized membrane protein
MYFLTLLLLHVAGAIVGFGPTFTFAVLGPLAGKLGGPPGLGVLESMSAIEKKLVLPVGLVVQPVTGVLLIFEGPWAGNFFSHEWLWIAIILYFISMVLALGVSNRALERMIALAKEGKAGSEEFNRARSTSQRAGPVLTVLLLAIIYLMIAKPT